MIPRYLKFCTNTFRLHTQTPSRCISSTTKSEIKKSQNLMFDNEKERQIEAIRRIEKIKVVYHGFEDEVTLLMNRDLSTPHDCAKHISEGVQKFSVLAYVDDKPWDVYKPLVSDCSLKLVTMQSSPNKIVNNAFWRSCSFILGAVIDSAFKDDITCHLHSFSQPNINSGSFIYDAYLDLPDWTPTKSELMSISSIFTKLVYDELPIERLEVSEELGLEMFRENPFKSKQVPNIAERNNGKIVLYRVGDHIDISKGPMIGNTRIIGRFALAAVHKIQNDAGESLRRFQGVALPKGISMNHFTFNILTERGRQLNETRWIPSQFEVELKKRVAVA